MYSLRFFIKADTKVLGKFKQTAFHKRRYFIILDGLLCYERVLQQSCIVRPFGSVFLQTTTTIKKVSLHLYYICLELSCLEYHTTSSLAAAKARMV